MNPDPDEFTPAMSWRCPEGHKLRPDRKHLDGPTVSSAPTAAAVRDAVLADQPAADVPGWRPIAELSLASKAQHVYWDGEVIWEGYIGLVCNATHFLVPPPKPDPFEVWWAKQNFGAFGSYKAECREAWNAAREAKA